MSKKRINSSNFEIKSKYNRTFSPSFKREKVSEILAKKISIKQFCQVYQVSRTTVYKWLYEYSNLEQGTKQVIQMESEALKTQQLIEQVAELERTIGQKQLEIDYLNKTLNLASIEVGYDLKKKYAPKSLSISDPIKKNPTTK